MTQREKALAGEITEEMKYVAGEEKVEAEIVRDGVAEGSVVITCNAKYHSIKPLAIGKGLKTKVNANIGTSKDHTSLEEEIEKLKVSIEAGADTVMDLSTGGDINEIRKEVIKESTIPVGTVPIYQAVIETVSERKKPFVEMSGDDIFKVIEKHCQDGVDFITVHCGVTLDTIRRLEKEGRLLDVVSRGGAFLVSWMKYNQQENPLFERFDDLLAIAKEHDVILSLGDGLRPGCLADATDRGQIQELLLLGELTDRAWDKGVQVMIEGPGHMPMNQIEANVVLQKQICKGAPFYVLGPLVIDIAPGYDHITSAIGGAIAAGAGADFLCYVTPSEHLRLPTLEDVREGVVASKIAAHAADIVKGVKGAMNKDIEMAKMRKELNWERQMKLALDPQKALHFRKDSHPQDSEVCTMCGEFCAIKVLKKELVCKVKKS